MATCNECIHFVDCCNDECTRYYSTIVACDNVEKRCNFFKDKANFVEVVHCKDCKYSRPLNNSKSPEKYFRDICVVCECEEAIGDEPMIYLGMHFCSFGQKKTD